MVVAGAGNRVELFARELHPGGGVAQVRWVVDDVPPVIDVGVAEVGEGLGEGFGAGAGEADADYAHGTGWVADSWWRGVGKAVEVFDEGPDGTGEWKAGEGGEESADDGEKGCGVGFGRL